MAKRALKDVIIVITIVFCILGLWFFGPYLFIALENIKNPIPMVRNIDGKIFFNSDRNGIKGQSIAYYYKRKLYPVHQGLQPKFNEKLGQIVYWGGINKGGLWIVDLRTEQYQRIPNTENVGIMGFDLSPDAKEICLMAKKKGDKTYNLYIMSINGTGLRKLTNFDHDYAVSPSYPRWSPDGKKITFDGPNLSKTVKPDWAKTPLHPGTIYIINKDSTGMRRVFQTNEGIDRWWGGRELSWSPDGTKLVFSSHKPGEPIDDIYVCNVDGTNLQKITNSPYHERDPVFSPDGNRIAYVAYTRGLSHGSEIYVINIDSTNKKRLTSPKLLHVGPLRFVWAEHKNPQWYK